MAPRAEPVRLIEGVSLQLQPGQITLIGGPSGSGKSGALRALGARLGPRAILLEQQQFDPRRAILEQVAEQGSPAEAISTLTACGLGEPRLWLRRFDDLSEGEQFRALLARAVDAARRTAGSVVLADEFCAVLHRRLAKAVSYNLRRLVTAGGLQVVLATTHDDLAADLQPDQVLRLGGGEPVVEQRQPRRGPVSFFGQLHIGRGCLRDYKRFEPMHYRQRTGLGPFEKIFVLREGVDGDVLAVVVYGYSPLSLHLRNVAVGRAYHRDGTAINRDFRILRRLIVHPDVRGCGLGHHLVARTLPQVGTKYVECLAAMGAVNPVFERAGMVRLGAVQLPAPQRRVHEQLARLEVDPLAADFDRQVASNRSLRELVGRVVHAWLRATTGRSMERIRGMGPAALAAGFVQLMDAAPIYYLWSAQESERTRLRTLAEGSRAGDPCEDGKGEP